MKKWIKIILVLVALGIIAAILVYKFYINKPHPDFDKLPAEYSLSASDLYDSYQSNKDSTDKIFNGKVIEINGTISSVEIVDTLVIATFVFKQGDFGDEGIRCTMLEKYNEETKKILPGADIKIKGFCSGFNDTDVILEKASLIK